VLFRSSNSINRQRLDAAARRAGRDPDREAFTADPERSVIRVGRELAETLDHLGLDARHIAAVHDGGGWEGRAGAYQRSRQTILAATDSTAGPVVVIDVHRDAVTERATVGGAPAASVLFVVARHNPWWQWNYVFARNLEAGLAKIEPGLSRGVRILEGCYNEDVSPLAVLVEIGGTDSTLAESLTTARLLAGVIADYLNGP